MIHLGLIGFPLGHSLSPKLHTAALQASEIEGDYSLFPISSDDKDGLKDLLLRVRSGEITGLNVTIPHKQSVIQFLDELTPTAKAIGAVNTIYLRKNKLIGDNTDAQGFLSDLKRFLNMECGSLLSHRQEQAPGFRNALILGAGGSARAVIYALIKDGWGVRVTSRRLEQVNELANSFPVIQVVEKIKRFDDLQLMVNTTPLGMTPNTDKSPWPKDLSFPNAAVYDLVYNPRETKLVKDARVAGQSATTGLGMLIEQAILAFELWTGKKVSREIMSSTVEAS